jgi:hypothetical protein
VVLEELLPAAQRRTDRYANNRAEADHGRLKAWLWPMRGRKQDRSATVVIAEHALVQNLRRGHNELAVAEPAYRRVAVAFDELAMAIWSGTEVASSACLASAQRNSAAWDASWLTRREPCMTIRWREDAACRRGGWMAVGHDRHPDRDWRAELSGWGRRGEGERERDRFGLSSGKQRRTWSLATRTRAASRTPGQCPNILVHVG